MFRQKQRKDSAMKDLVKYKSFIGKKIDLKIKDETYKGRTLIFAGRNHFDHKVIVTSGQGIHYVDSWKDVEIVEFVDERIFQD